MTRLFRLAVALFVHRDVHYVRRLLGRAGANLRLVLGALGAHYVRVLYYRDFGGVDPSESCERYVAGVQPSGFVRVNLIPYHLALAEVADRVVVEAGCNEGPGSALLATRARSVVAFDRSPEAIAVARARHVLPNLKFVVHDAVLPFPVEDGSADVVFSSEVIEHLPDGRAFLAAAARALRPGGLLVLKTPNDAFNRFENRLNPHHVNSYDERRLRGELARDFESVEISHLTFAISIDTAPEERPDPLAPESTPYVLGETVVIDRVLVTRMTVTPRVEPPGTHGEYLFAHAVRRAGSA